MTAAERERYQRRYGFLPKKDQATTTEMQTPREQGRIKLIGGRGPVYVRSTSDRVEILCTAAKDAKCQFRP